MLASRFARASAGISYPNLYRNSAASPWARWANALASAIDPVMTQPTEGEIWKMWDTEAGSISLSYVASISIWQNRSSLQSPETSMTYRNLLL